MAQAKPPAVQETEEEVLDRKVFECLCALLDVGMLTREFARFMEDIGELPAASNLPTTVHHPDDGTEFPKVGCIALADWSTDEIAAQIQLQWSACDRAIGKAIIAVARIRAFIDDKDQPSPDRLSARIIAELHTFTAEHSYDDRGHSCIPLDRDWVGELRQLDRYIARQRIKITSMEWPLGGAEDEATSQPVAFPARYYSHVTTDMINADMLRKAAATGRIEVIKHPGKQNLYPFSGDDGVAEEWPHLIARFEWPHRTRKA